MDLTFITDLYIPIVVLFCLMLGYVLKKWIKDVDNKYIPTILATVGAIIACLSTRNITIENVVYGAITGLASTGLHQAFTQIIENKKE